jgi:energy-coupling factor transporter ATP-binding protein EcfA2
MPLEDQIVAWSRTRPAWQRVVLRRVAEGDALADQDYDQVVEDMLASRAAPEVEFGLAQLPEAAPEDVSVRLVSIEKAEHVNALASETPLTFGPSGLTIVYGDNASGKSGYARLLKRIARSRHQEEVLSDVFRDTNLATPTATLKVRVGEDDRTFPWPEASAPELKRMLYYDGACCGAYISDESDFPYRPSALFVMDGLIEACVAIRSRIDARLEANGKATTALPVIDDEVKDTEAGQLLARLSGSTSVDAVDALIAKLDQAAETVEHLKEQEARLRAADSTKERQRLTREAQKLDAIRTHLETVHAALAGDALAALREQRGRVMTLQEAAEVLARAFESEPLAGVGSSPWKELWESARRYSEIHAYPDKGFPVLDPASRCVLCQQTLDPGATDRLSRFERFVTDDTQVRLQEARDAYDKQVRSLTKLVVSSEAVATNLTDLEVGDADLVNETRRLLGRHEAARTTVVAALGESGDVQVTPIELEATMARLREAAANARASAESLSDPAVLSERLAAVTTKRKELELLHKIKGSRAAIVAEIGRLKDRLALDAAKSDAATGSITKKVLELSEENITEVLRDAFTRESDRLQLERVTIGKTRAERGALLHQPKLVGARQNVTLPRVFSEGERTALGLAAFFTEAQLDDSKSALILDDPVNSLDHIRRGLVASRLAALAETRQVVVFTHDVSFVADLKRAANSKGVPIAERSVVRSRAQERRPGACTTKHPWKAKDVAERINELRNGFARIKRERNDWDDATYEKEVADWAGSLSETWERIFSQEIVGAVLAEGGLEVRPNMVKVLARFSNDDEQEFQASYSRVSQWAKRHDKSVLVNYVAPDIEALEGELNLVDSWFKRVKGYKS